jgi:hypothetical protein
LRWFWGTEFPQKYDNESNTVTIMPITKGFIFSDFAPLVSDSRNHDKVENAHNNFIFSVGNPHNIADKTFSLTNPIYTIHYYSSHDRTFGGGKDIHVTNESNNWCTRVQDSSVNDTGSAGNQFFTGEFTFTGKEIELFQVSDSII